MTRDAILQWLRREPFVPFEVRSSDGRSFAVAHPECAALGKTTLIVFLDETDRFVELALLHVAGIEKVSRETSSP